MRVVGTLAPVTGDTQSPSQPQNLSATAVNRRRVDLAWTASSDNIEVNGYQIFRDGAPLDTTSATSYTDSTVTDSTTYAYTVVAFDTSGNSSIPSAAAQTTTPANSTPTWSAIPDQSPTVGDSVFIDLTDYCTDADLDSLTFTIESGTLPTGLAKVGSIISGTIATAGQSADLTILADDSFDSASTTLSIETFGADVTAPPVPTGGSATAQSQTAILVAWSASVDVAGSAFELVTGTQDYRVYRSTDGVNFTLRATVTGTSYQDTGLSAGTTYYYRITARDVALNESAQSATVSATTEAAGGLVFVPPSSTTPQPAIYGGAGYGMETFHCMGSGGRANPNITVLTVDRLTGGTGSGSGTTGSLPWCLTRNFPRLIEFGVSGTIQLGGSINVDNPYVYLAGQTAPSPGIFLRQGLINVRCQNFVIAHINSYMGGESGSPATDSRDAMAVSAGAGTGVIANNSLFWSVDESTQLYNNTGNVTYWQNLMAEPLDRSALKLALGDAHHGYHVQVDGEGGGTPTNFAFLRNSLCLGVNRHPLCRAWIAMIADNIIYNWGRALPGSTASPTTAGGCMVFTSRNGVPTQSNVEGNLYLAGPDHSGSQPPINSSISPEGPLAPGSRIYQAHNRLFGQSGSMTGNTAGVANLYASSRIAAAWHSNYQRTFDATWSSADFVELHRRFVGACPTYTTGRRNLQFTRMRNYLAGSGSMGQVIDEVTDVSGGWGNIPTAGVIQNTIDHTAAGAHNGDPRPTGASAVEVMPSGRLRIEEWLDRRYSGVMA